MTTESPDVTFTPDRWRLIHPSGSRDVVTLVRQAGGMVVYRRRGHLEQVPVDVAGKWRPAP